MSPDPSFEMDTRNNREFGGAMIRLEVDEVSYRLRCAQDQFGQERTTRMMPTRSKPGIGTT